MLKTCMYLSYLARPDSMSSAVWFWYDLKGASLDTSMSDSPPTAPEIYDKETLNFGQKILEIQVYA